MEEVRGGAAEWLVENLPLVGADRLEQHSMLGGEGAPCRADGVLVQLPVRAVVGHLADFARVGCSPARWRIRRSWMRRGRGGPLLVTLRHADGRSVRDNSWTARL